MLRRRRKADATATSSIGVAHGVSRLRPERRAAISRPMSAICVADITEPRREQLPVLNIDMSTIERLQSRKVSPQFRSLSPFESPVCEPSPHKVVDCLMVPFRNVVIALELFDEFERAPRGRVVRVTQSWKQALLFIRRVLRRGGCKINQRRLDLSTLRGRQQSPRGPARYRDENAEEILDAAMAVGEQTQRLSEVVVWRSANRNRHG